MEFSEEAHRQLAKQANGRVWQLLDRPDRSPDETAELIESAYASLYHWRFAGTEVHRQRGLWLVARVYTVIGEGELALRYAQGCLETTNENRHLMQDFDVAYAHEGMARALALAGQREAALNHRQKARDIGERISDAEDKSIFTADLESGEWYGIS